MQNVVPLQTNDHSSLSTKTETIKALTSPSVAMASSAAPFFSPPTQFDTSLSQIIGLSILSTRMATSNVVSTSSALPTYENSMSCGASFDSPDAHIVVVAPESKTADVASSKLPYQVDVLDKMQRLPISSHLEAYSKILVHGNINYRHLPSSPNLPPLHPPAKQYAIRRTIHADLPYSAFNTPKLTIDEVSTSVHVSSEKSLEANDGLMPISDSLLRTGSACATQQDVVIPINDEQC